MNLLHMDSHINLQNLRWPFHSRYSVPTVLGTPTSLSIQNTVLSSLRGNISQNIAGAEIERSHEIDLRYVVDGKSDLAVWKTMKMIQLIAICFPFACH